MDFREYATNETAALVERLAAAAAANVEAATTGASQAADEAAARAAAEAEAALRRAVEEATAAGQRAVEQAEADARKALEQADAEARRAVEEVTAAGKRAVEQAEADARKAVEQAQSEARRGVEEAGRALAAARADLQRETDEKQALAAERAQLTAALSAAQMELEAAKAQHDATAAELTTAASNETALREQIAEAERARGAAQAERDRTAAAPSQLLARLVTTFQNLSTGATIAELLAQLVDALAADFSRVVLFTVKGNRLEGERQIGFEFKTDISKVIVPLTIDSLLARAVASGHVERLTGAALADPKHAPFGGAPRCAVALPVAVHGETLAVLYADDAGQGGATDDIDDPAARLATAELLLRHASVLLVRLSEELKVLTELRDYATMLLNEVEYMYTADVRAKKSAEDLQGHLQANLECARQIFAQRVSSEGPAAAALLEERLSAVVESKRGTPFARALVAAAGRADLATGHQAAAEAS